MCVDSVVLAWLVSHSIKNILSLCVGFFSGLFCASAADEEVAGDNLDHMSRPQKSDMRITPKWFTALHRANKAIMNTDGSCPTFDYIGFTPEIARALKGRLVDVFGANNLPENFMTMEEVVINTNFNHDSMAMHVDDVRVCDICKILVNLERHHVTLNRCINLYTEDNYTDFELCRQIPLICFTLVLQEVGWLFHLKISNIIRK
jgi:hypothetical protein